MRIVRGDSPNAAVASLVISSILWGSSFISIKIGLEYVDAYDFAFLRLALASLILIAILLGFGQFTPSVMKERSIWLLGLLNGIAFSLQYVGMIFTTAAKSALLIDLNIIFVAVLSWRVFAEPFGLRKHLGVALGTLGAFLVTVGGEITSLIRGELLGDLLVFLAGLVWAFFTVLQKWVLLRGQRRNAIELSAVILLITALLLFPLAAVLGGLNLKSIPAQGWAIIVFIALACTVIPFALWVFALGAVTATVASVVAMLEIVVAMILSALLVGESYSTITLIGALFVLISIFVVAES